MQAFETQEFANCPPHRINSPAIRSRLQGKTSRLCRPTSLKWSSLPMRAKGTNRAVIGNRDPMISWRPLESAYLQDYSILLSDFDPPRRDGALTGADPLSPPGGPSKSVTAALWPPKPTLNRCAPPPYLLIYTHGQSTDRETS